MKQEIRLTTLQQEQLGRLLAEWRLAQAQAELAGTRFQQAVTATCAQHGVQGEATVDIERGVIQATAKDE